jgi:hypothetical protein
MHVGKSARLLFCWGSLLTCAENYRILAVPWLRQLVNSFLVWRPGFNPRPVHVGFVVDKVAMRQVFSPLLPIFPCHYYSTNAPQSFLIPLSPMLYNLCTWRCHSVRHFTLLPCTVLPLDRQAFIHQPTIISSRFIILVFTTAHVHIAWHLMNCMANEVHT